MLFTLIIFNSAFALKTVSIASIMIMVESFIIKISYRFFLKKNIFLLKFLKNQCSLEWIVGSDFMQKGISGNGFFCEFIFHKP